MFAVDVAEAEIAVPAVIAPALPVDDHRPGECDAVPGGQLIEVGGVAPLARVVGLNRLNGLQGMGAG